MEDLKDLTQKLLELNEEAMTHYKRVRDSGEKGDFYQEVKPFADEVKQYNDRWKEKMLLWAKTHKPKHLYPQQIMNTSENIEMTSVSCFFPETSYSRFISHHQSIQFVLETSMKELESN